MSKLKLTGKELRAIGLPEGPVISDGRINTFRRVLQYLKFCRICYSKITMMKKIRLFILSIGCLLAGAASAQEYKIENNEVKIDKEIQFKPGTAELLPESDAALLVIKKYLDDKAYISLLRIESHTDNSGDAQANQSLSEKRAEAVGDRLVALGVNCNRLLAVGFGGTKPIATNSTPEGKAQNRRTSFVNAQLRGKSIGGMPVDGGGKIGANLCR